MASRLDVTGLRAGAGDASATMASLSFIDAALGSVLQSEL